MKSMVTKFKKTGLIVLLMLSGTFPTFAQDAAMQKVEFLTNTVKPTIMAVFALGALAAFLMGGFKIMKGDENSTRYFVGGAAGLLIAALMIPMFNMIKTFLLQ